MQSWNTQHDAPSDRIGVMMPINIRPADRAWEVVSNLTSMVSVSTEPDDRANLASATAAVAEQTVEMRRNNRAYGLYDLLDALKPAPMMVKRAVPRLVHVTGDWFVDTAMLLNLGRLPAPPTFGPKPASELWFSPPCDPTCTLSVGVATCEQRLSLVARYRYEQFNARTAEDFIC